MSSNSSTFMDRFFTFEGGEGSGKSTQAKLLHQAFIHRNIESVLTREPGGTESAEVIRDLLLHSKVDFYPITQLLLHNASRYEHIKSKIIPALSENKIVICDRFVDSTIAYQGYGHQLGKEFPALLHNICMENVNPHLTFILDIDPKKGLERAKSRSTLDNYEKLDLSFHNRVRQGFLEIAANAPHRCIVISSENNISQIHQQIIDIINISTKFDIEPIKTD